MPRQYVQCKFRAEDRRTYTYHWDGDEPVQSDDFLKVEDARSDGWKRVQCVGVTDEAPPFPTKPILGQFNPDVDGLSLADMEPNGGSPYA